MRVAHFLVPCLCALVLAGCASRQPPRGLRTAGHDGPAADLLKYDANHDGTLTRAELTAGLRAEFNADDTKHTGCLDKDQVAAINAKRVIADKSLATPLQDWNQDGCVDFSEFAALAYSEFDELDRNGDGVITPAEFDSGRRPQATETSQPHNGGRRGRRPPP